MPNDLKALLIKNKNSTNDRRNISFDSNANSKPNYKSTKLPSYSKKSFAKTNLHELIANLLAKNDENSDDADTEDAYEDN